MKKLAILSFALCVAVNGLFAQQKEAIVLSIDGQGVTLEEFENIFKKNNRDSVITQQSLDEYMQLYINFKLKVAEARSMGLDTLTSFKNELAGYRSQLARPYLVDGTMLDGMMLEAYERLKEEIRASHLLVKCDANASAQDTLRAFQKIMQLRNKIMAGEAFEKVALTSSEDPSAKDNSGDLGYFTAFQMVYPFETAAYQTQVGQISMPIRTKYGYHLVKVYDRRPARGEIHVAHIMIREKQDDPKFAENKINEISGHLKAGNKTFEQLANEFSDDGSSNKKGGELPWFGINKMVSEFEEASFALKNNGEISEPFKTSYGWHIVKRLDYKPLAPYASMEKDLKSKVQKDSRSEKTRASFLTKLKKEYGYQESQKVMAKLIAAADTNVFKSQWKVSKSLSKKTLCKIGDKVVTAGDFVTFMNTRRPGKNKISPHDFVRNEMTGYCNDQVLQKEDSQLESKYPAFRLLMKEYEEGILLFELTDKKVWSKSTKDTTGLREFYETNKMNYLWPDRAELVVFTCENADYSKRVRKLLDTDMEYEGIEAEMNQDGKLHVELDGGTYAEQDRPILSQFDWHKQKTNPVDIDANGKKIVVRVIKVLPSEPKKLKEAKGVISNDYQQWLEKTWLESLRQGHQIQINPTVLYSIH